MVVVEEGVGLGVGRREVPRGGLRVQKHGIWCSRIEYWRIRGWCCERHSVLIIGIAYSYVTRLRGKLIL